MKNDPPISKEELTKLYYENRSVHKVGAILGKCGDAIWRWLKHYEVPPIPKMCNECSVSLNEDNTYPSDWKSGCRMCKDCRYEQYRSNITPEKQSTYSIISRLKIKEDIFNIYGNECECCGETGWQFLSIDHIGNWGGQHKKDIGNDRGGSSFYQWLKNNNYPKEGFRVLCMNCNACIGFHGFCPHTINVSRECVDCNIILDDDNQFYFHKVNSVSLCKECILLRSIKRKTAQNEINEKGATLEERRKWAKNHSLNLRKQIIEGYGSECMCCGEDDYMFLTIDHINNDGATERILLKDDMHSFYTSLIKKGFPADNYQLLCYNCNCSKGFYGKCYHQLCKELNINNISIGEYKDIILSNKGITNV